MKGNTNWPISLLSISSSFFFYGIYIKGVKSQKATRTLKTRIQINKVDLNVIMESFVNMTKINNYMKFLEYQQCMHLQ